MELTVLGSGSTVPHPGRTSAAFWLETGGGNILLDCSATAASRMAACHVDWPNIDAIWISHFHLDHCGGLAPMLQGFKHSERMRGRDKPLRIFGASGLKGLIDRSVAVNNYKILDQRFSVEICEIRELEKFKIVPGVEAVAMKTPHTDESHAIHIRDAQTTFVYSADTGFDEKVGAFINGVDLAVLECTFIQNKPVEKHLELAEAMYLIRKGNPRRALLTHFYPEWDTVNFEEEVKRFSPPCEVMEAVDGMKISI
jgi:ribonuclease BN (tRNA processing enzyme)